MERVMTVLIIVVAGWAVQPVAAQSERPYGYCGVCHSEVAVKYRPSAHAFEDLNCTSCHGGDPTSTDVEGAHAGDFLAEVSRLDIPEFCGSCHSDPVQMAPYGLPADQLALYRISGHGRGLADGNEDVAVCSDCHGVHEVLRAQNPASPVHGRNLSTTCATCHGGEGAVVEDYESSIHHAAMRSSNPRAPSCVSCHGSHGAAPPGSGSVGKVCGQCHSSTRQAFRSGPHAQGMVAAGEPECAACHDNHRVTGMTDEPFDALCADCHEAGSNALVVGAKIVALLQGSRLELERAEQSLETARSVPLPVADYESRLEQAHTFLAEARPQSHSLDPEAVGEFTRKARSIAREVQSDVASEIHILEGRDLVVLVLWLYILVTVVALQFYRRSLH